MSLFQFKKVFIMAGICILATGCWQFLTKSKKSKGKSDPSESVDSVKEESRREAEFLTLANPQDQHTHTQKSSVEVSQSKEDPPSPQKVEAPADALDLNKVAARDTKPFDLPFQTMNVAYGVSNDIHAYLDDERVIYPILTYAPKDSPLEQPKRLSKASLDRKKNVSQTAAAPTTVEAKEKPKCSIPSPSPVINTFVGDVTDDSSRSAFEAPVKPVDVIPTVSVCNEPSNPKAEDEGTEQKSAADVLESGEVSAKGLKTKLPSETLVSMEAERVSVEEKDDVDEEFAATILKTERDDSAIGLSPGHSYGSKASSIAESGFAGEAALGKWNIGAPEFVPLQASPYVTAAEGYTGADTGNYYVPFYAVNDGNYMVEFPNPKLTAGNGGVESPFVKDGGMRKGKKGGKGYEVFPTNGGLSTDGAMNHTDNSERKMKKKNSRGFNGKNGKGKSSSYPVSRGLMLADFIKLDDIGAPNVNKKSPSAVSEVKPSFNGKQPSEPTTKLIPSVKEPSLATFCGKVSYAAVSAAKAPAMDQKTEVKAGYAPAFEESEPLDPNASEVVNSSHGVPSQ